jgi:hypothetical protein
MVAFAQVLTVIVAIYVAAGLLFALPFVLRGVNRIDPVAREGTWGFRMIIVPGVVVLWPMLALRWLRGTQPPEEKNAHRVAAKRGSR